MENSRIPGEHFFTTSDNTALFYRHWPALQPGLKRSSSYFIAVMNILVVYNISLMNWRCQILFFMPGMPEGMDKLRGRVVIAHLLRVQCRMSMNLFVLLPAIARSDWMRW
ncbi:hypothetical protein HMPREF9542_00055 [Escherichia coli MS 117-3]|nr:hypothetical protein HMPREF9542_00055 [Escherichia coli MS 117-3]